MPKLPGRKDTRSYVDPEEIDLYIGSFKMPWEIWGTYICSIKGCGHINRECGSDMIGSLTDFSGEPFLGYACACHTQEIAHGDPPA